MIVTASCIADQHRVGGTSRGARKGCVRVAMVKWGIGRVVRGRTAVRSIVSEKKAWLGSSEVSTFIVCGKGVQETLIKDRIIEVCIALGVGTKLDVHVYTMHESIYLGDVVGLSENRQQMHFCAFQISPVSCDLETDSQSVLSCSHQMAVA